MQVHQLRYFCAVARSGNFTRAAEQEHIAQPSLSAQILKLEDELGARLFDRLGRTARLTHFGRTFLPRAEAILRQLGAAKLEIQEMAGGDNGRVVIGAIPTIAPYFLPGPLTSFAIKYPHIKVSIVEEITSVLLQGLHEARLDLALAALPVSGEGLICEELLRERLYVVLPARHHLASQKQISLKQIEEENFLLLKEGHCFRDNAIAACRRARLQPNVVFESGQFATIVAMVAAGMGVSLVPTMAVEPRKGCRFVPLADEASHRRVGIVQLKQHFPTRAHRALVEHLRENVRQEKQFVAAS
ncbi:MAG TPA: LysR family transcriptional regulator [Terriglobales bacterium]|nr:LysR family transcriptional regulator [Terriglobales bacterium]